MSPRHCLLVPLILLVGCVYQGEPACGECDLTLADGSVYSGPLKDGLMHGYGTLTYPDGGVYEGAFRHGRLHGHGTFTDSSGDTLSGEFANGDTVGRGVITFADGGHYAGQWRDWMAHGEGEWVTESGDVYRGRFDENVLSGQASIVLADGERYTGGVEWWRYHGEGVLDSADGDHYEGHFEHGWYSGRGTLTTPNGGRYTGEFRDGVYHGEGALSWLDADGTRRTLAGPWSRGYYVGPDRRRYVTSGLALPDPEALLFEQPALLRRAVQGLAPSRPAHTDLYVLTFAADGNQDVFRKEALLAQNVLHDVYGTRERTLGLVNSPHTLAESPLATGTNLRVALREIARVMDTQEDILLLFLTSHGSRDHKLSVDLPGASLNNLAASTLREELDAAGIQWRVVVVSACYSGGFIGPLRDERTMVITSARSDRTSFGCSDDADLTYFGRAFFEQALPSAASLEEAFFSARKVIQRRERQDGLMPSEPQIHNARGIAAKLGEIRRVTMAAAERPR